MRSVREAHPTILFDYAVVDCSRFGVLIAFSRRCCTNNNNHNEATETTLEIEKIQAMVVLNLEMKKCSASNSGGDASVMNNKSSNDKPFWGAS